MIDFAPLTFFFPSIQGVVQQITQTAVFSSRINRANCAIGGFDVGFTNDDHHLFKYTIDSSVTGINQNTVMVTVRFLLRDNSGNIDDPFNGNVRVLVIVDRA